MYKIFAFIVIVILGIAGYFLLSSNSSGKLPANVLVFTQVPALEDIVEENGLTIPDYNQSRIVSIDYTNPEESIRNLTPDFHSACSPSLSSDNKQIVFSGKKNVDDKWQIWTMDLSGSHVKNVIKSDENCLSPAFLPDGKIVFSKEWNDQKSGRGFALFTCQTNGSELYQITFHPHIDIHSTVLHDGRIAVNSQQVYPEAKKTEFMVLRPDGTKCQSFYHELSTSGIKSKVAEHHSGKLFFIESDGESDFFVSLKYGNPSHSKKIIAKRLANRLHSADILDTVNLIVSYQSLKNGVFSLYTMNETGEEELIYMDKDYHSIEPAAVRQKAPPKKLPSTASLEKGIATLIGLNAGYSQIELDGNPETKYVRVLGVNRILQEIPVAEDGSFYLKVQSDTPIRFQSLGENWELLRGPSAWIWLRANERRGCVGCHARKEIAPVNVVPKAIYNPPYWVTDTTGQNMDESIVWHEKVEVGNEN